MFDEEDWTNLKIPHTHNPFNVSKTLEEKAAWEYIASTDNTTNIKLTVKPNRNYGTFKVTLEP